MPAYSERAVAAVVRFQRSVGLDPDGVVGPRTFAALRRRYGWRVWRRGARQASPRRTRTSARGIELIASFEGSRAEPYDDPVGLATVGYGHLIARRSVDAADGRARWVAGQAVPGRLTEPEARRLLAHDLAATYEPSVAALELPLRQPQFDALVSFVYNLGPGAIGAGTGIGKALRARDWATAADEMLRWDKAGGHTLPGLTRRRRAERELFLTRS
jgi:GH24 family phage-related lysozyme (muramidase)